MPLKIVTGLRCDGGLSPQEHTIVAGGIDWRYLEWGDHGPPLVLWHGVTSDASGWWRVGPTLAGLGFHVYAPDLPGHGLTGDAPHGYNVEHTARLLDSWMAALNFAAPVVLGHSWGGMNALVHTLLPDAQVHPRALVLEDPALQLARNGEQYISAFTAGIGIRGDEAARAEIAALNPRWHECDVWWKVQARERACRSAVEGFFLDNAGANFVPLLRNITIPTLLLLADHTFGGIWAEQHVAIARAGAAPTVTTQVLAGSSHNMHRDAFAPFSITVGSFLRPFLMS